MSAPPDETSRAIELATAAHQGLLDRLVVLGAEVDTAAPSRLPGWTKGHVLAHVVNGGAGLSGLFDAAAEGRVGDLYPGGLEQRTADIERGARHDLGSLVDSLRAVCADLETRWAESDWDGSGRTPAGEFPLVDLPFFRLREVLIHHVDLDVGEEFEDLPGEYVRHDLRIMEMRWRARQPMGVARVPEAALRAAPPARLAWLMGRRPIDGLGPAGVL